MAKNSSWYNDLEKDIIGFSEIAKMRNYNNFDPRKIVEAIICYKDDIARVRSLGDDTIGIFLKENLGDKKVRDIMITLFGLNVDEINTENDEILIWWD
jgi:hypothetical protein